MNEFKSKTNISDYVISMKVKQDQYFPYLIAWNFYFQMNKFKSKINISDYVIPMKVKRGTVFPLSKSLTFILLNERIQIENDY